MCRAQPSPQRCLSGGGERAVRRWIGSLCPFWGRMPAAGLAARAVVGTRALFGESSPVAVALCPPAPHRQPSEETGFFGGGSCRAVGAVRSWCDLRSARGSGVSPSSALDSFCARQKARSHRCFGVLFARSGVGALRGLVGVYWRLRAVESALLVPGHQERGGGDLRRRRGAPEEPAALCSLDLSARGRPVRRFPCLFRSKIGRLC